MLVSGQPALSRADALNQLCEVFPHLKLQDVRAALEAAKFDVAAAAQELSEVIIPPTGQLQAHLKAGAHPRDRRKGWSEVRDAAPKHHDALSGGVRYVRSKQHQSVSGPTFQSNTMHQKTRSAIGTTNSGEEQELHAVQLLALQHDWASTDLIQATLQACGWNIPHASAALWEMKGGEGSSSSSEDDTPSETTSAPSSASNTSELHHGYTRPPAHQDLYRLHRSRALKLTRAWKKHIQRAATAFAAGDHHACRTLALEASRLRAQAVAAHQEAAHNIQNTLNRDRAEYELDLHGLHAAEAVEALRERLQLLQAQPPAANSSSSAARRRELKVIVGRGLHSRDGEASLPRVVESFLLGEGLRFTWRTGAIMVQLPRPHPWAGR